MPAVNFKPIGGEGKSRTVLIPDAFIGLIKNGYLKNIVMANHAPFRNVKVDKIEPEKITLSAFDGLKRYSAELK